LSPLKHIALGALALVVLALAPATAEASMTNFTAPWCKQKGATDQVIVSGALASLIFRADGDLVLQPTNHLVSKIWSSGTAGTGAKICWTAAGTLAVHDAAGATLWSRSGGTLPSLPPGEYAYTLAPSLAECDLSAAYKVYGKPSTTGTFPTSSSDPTFSPGSGVTPWNSPLLTKGALWTRAATCPVVSESVVGDDWCLDTAAERVVLQGASSKLVWRQGGQLALLGTGLADDRQIWATPTDGAGTELCLRPTGQLVILDATRKWIWSTPADTITTSSHLFELDECNLTVKRADGSAALWTRANRCPQTTSPVNRHWAAGTGDVLILENATARLWYQPDGNVVLRSASGDEVWHSALVANRGKRLSFQSDGNLVIYDALDRPVWASNTAGRGVTALQLDGCAIALRAAGETKWSRGGASCPSGALANTPAWSLPASGNLTILRTAESRLVWQGDGNLVLYTAGGAPVWASNTDRAGKALSFQPDGNLVVYRVTGSDAPADALWASGTWYTGGASHALRLGDHCTLTITDLSGSAVKWTGSNACTVVSYTFERADGDARFGSALRTHVTAKDDGVAQLHSTTGIEVTVLGARIELLGAAAAQVEDATGSIGETSSFTIFGESTVSVNVTYEKTFFERSQTFSVGPVPVTVSVGVTGQLGIGLSSEGGALVITPVASIEATVQAGVGGECDLGGASAGVRGTLTLIAVQLPIRLKLSLENGQPRFTLRGDLTIESLSGALSLYAEAYVKICWVKVSAQWSKELFRWKGIEWTRTLFSKSGTF
jgi:hypothetical protein